MTSNKANEEITLDIDTGTPPTQLAAMFTEKGLKPLFEHASRKHFARRAPSRSFEDGIDPTLVSIIETYYATLLKDTLLAENFAKIRLRLMDLVTQLGIEVAEVQIENIGKDGETKIHPQEEAQGTQPRIAIFMPPKLPGPNISLHNPFGQGRIRLTANREITAEILSHGQTPPINRSIAKSPRTKIEANEPRIQEPGDTLTIIAAVQSRTWNGRSGLHQVADFQKLDSSKTPYHQLTDVPWASTPPVAVFAQTLK